MQHSHMCWTFFAFVFWLALVCGAQCDAHVYAHDVTLMKIDGVNQVEAPSTGLRWIKLFTL